MFMLEIEPSIFDHKSMEDGQKMARKTGFYLQTLQLSDETNEQRE